MLILIGAASLLGALLIVVLVVAASPWFAWQAAGAQASDIALAVRLRAFPPQTLAKLTPYLPAKAQELTAGDYSYIAAIQEDSQTEFWLRPRLAKQFSAGRTLSQAGWQVQRVGLWLAVRDRSPGSLTPKQPLQIFFSAAGSWTRAAISAHQATYPAALVRIAPGQLSAVPLGATVAAHMRGNQLAGYYQLNEKWPTAESSLAYPGQESEEDAIGLLVALPSSFLPAIPGQLRQEWIHWLEGELALSHARAPIAEEISKYGQLSVASGEPVRRIGGEDISLAVTDGTEEFTAAVEKWAAEETAYHAPTQRAFRLPDGTLGYELVPTTLESFLTLTNEDRNCRGGRNEILELWVCRAEGWVAISPNQGLAKQHLARLKRPANPADKPSEWQIHIESPRAARLNIPGLAEIVLAGEGPSGSFIVDWQP